MTHDAAGHAGGAIRLGILSDILCPCCIIGDKQPERAGRSRRPPHRQSEIGGHLAALVEAAA